MSEVMRQRPSIILALICKLVARRMPQDVGMYWEWELSSSARSLDHPQEPGGRYWRASLNDEHVTMQGMDALNSALGPVHMQATMVEIDLSPSQGAEFSGSEAMPISE
jgi:hypothetical protein